MENPKPSPIGALLRQHRLEGGWTQEELAERASISVEAIKTLERGTRRSPRHDTVQRLADGLGLQGDARAGFLAASREGRAPARQPLPLPTLLIPHASAPSAGHVRWAPPRLTRRLPLVLAFLGILLAALTVAVLVLHPGSQAGSAPAFDDQPLATWGGAPSSLTLRSPGGVAVDDRGNVYVADTGDNRIVELSARGRTLAYWGGSGQTHATFRSPAAVAVSSSGNFFVADTGNNQIQSLTPTGVPVAQWGDLHPGFVTTQGADLYHLPASVAAGAAGVVYLTDPPWNWVAGIDSATGNERYFSVTSSGPPADVGANAGGDIAVTIPSAGRVYLCRPAAYIGATDPVLEPKCHGYGAGVLEDPQGVALDAQDDMYVTDRARDRVVKISRTAQLLSAWGSKGSGPGKFEDPQSLALDSQGNIYVADAGNNRIQKLSPSGAPLAEWGGSKPPIQLRSPSTVAVDHGGHVYVITSDGGQQIAKLTERGALVKSWNDGGALGGLAAGTDGALYAVDSLRGQVVRMSVSGSVLARWGKLGSGTGELSDPSAITADDHGNLYVADAGNSRIVRFSAGNRPFGQWRQVVGPAAGIIAPTSIAVDRHGDLYIGDAGNHRIVVFSPQGLYLRGWEVQTPTAVAIDRGGRVYVIDEHAGRVVLSTAFGRLLGTMGGRGSRPGQLQNPQSLALDQTGRVYVADTGNDRIQVFRSPG